MKKLLFTLALSLLCIVAFGRELNQPGAVSKKVTSLRSSYVTFQPVNVFSQTARISQLEVLKEVKDYTALAVDPIIQNYLVASKPQYIKLYIPGLNANVLLYRHSSFDELNVITSSGIKPNLRDIVEYRGAIEGNPNSVASFTFTSNDVIGMVCNDQGNFVIGKLTKDERYIIYNDADLRLTRSFECGTNETHVIKSKTEPSSQFIVGLKCINWYYETDYDIFVNKGSVTNVTSYIQGMFAQVATLYANDSMNIRLKTLFVWDTVDPYTATTTSSLLTQFGQTRTTFNGDLAHLLGYVGNGGIAYVNSMCSATNQYKMAYSDINPTYSLVPTYSWTIECVSHEQGHNVASKHTHDCAWNGNNTPIDGCGPAAGYTTNCTAGPLPSGGGTIMSYCHLVSGIGINFNLGFGPQPSTLMRNTIAAKTCLFACDTTGTGGGGGGTGCTSVPAQPGTISGPTNPCAGTTNAYSVAPVAGATSYTWQMVSGWTGTSTTNTISITAGTSAGNIAVFASNACGNGSPQTLYVTSQSVPAIPSTITGPTGVCKNQAGVIYTTSLVANATSYTWTVPTGAVITAGQGTSTITVTFGTRKGRVTVKANNSCGSSATKAINVNITCKEMAPEDRDFTIAINPNPANDLLNINIESRVNDSYVIMLRDISGKVIYVRKRVFGVGHNLEVINVNEFTPGIYLLEIVSGNTIFNDKVLIQN